MEKILRDGEYLHSTHGIWYSVRHHVSRYTAPDEPIPCRCFLLYEIGDRKLIPSISCCLVGEEDYYPLQERRFTARLRSHYPHISRGCAAKITESFMEILQIANATHSCPQFSSGARFVITHAVVIKIHEAPEDFDPKVRPATRASIMELLMASPRTAWNTDKECSICMEEMQPSNTMLWIPCSHSFHRTCILRWLDCNHFCPLCRYQLPPANYRSLLHSC